MSNNAQAAAQKFYYELTRDPKTHQITGALAKPYLNTRPQAWIYAPLKSASVTYITVNGQQKVQLTFRFAGIGGQSFTIGLKSKDEAFTQSAHTRSYIWEDGTVHKTDFKATGSIVSKTATGDAQLTVTYADGLTNNFTGKTAMIDQKALLTKAGKAWISDPNTKVVAPSWTVYNLVRGTPDLRGPDFSSLYTNVNDVGIIGRLDFYTLSNVSNDVLNAYRNGWTGLNKSIVNFGSFACSRGLIQQCGAGQFSADQDNKYWIGTRYIEFDNAQGALSYYLDIDLVGTGPKDISQNQFSVSNLSGIIGNGPATPWIPPWLTQNSNPDNPNRLKSDYYIDVVAFNEEFLTKTEGARSKTNPAGIVDQMIGLMNGKNKSGINNLSSYSVSHGGAALNFTDAVIVTGAGQIAAGNTTAYLTQSLLSTSPDNSDVLNRTLIVGALTGDGIANAKPKTAGTGTLAKDSINPSSLKSITNLKDRFLVASGASGLTHVCFGDKIIEKCSAGDQNVNGMQLDQITTINAASRVASYTAIIRQKFPNLTAANTADILLRTARYDTLSCYPNCDKAIYGQGEASLSRALAPVGYLR